MSWRDSEIIETSNTKAEWMTSKLVGSEPMDENKLLDKIKKSEGFSDKVYKDSEGFDTIGYGHKVKPGEDWSKGITEKEAEELARKDMSEAISNAKKLKYWDKLSSNRQDAVAEMIYNLGYSGFKGFKRANKHLEQGKYDLAAAELLNSKWASQVKGRARNLANEILVG